MPYAIIAKDKPGSTGLRAELRPAHVEHLTRHATKVLAAGPLLADDAATPIGSLIILDTEDRAELDAFIAADPYTEGGLFQSVTVMPWRKVILGGKRDA